MKDCPPDKVFWLANGGTLKNLSELVSSLESMDDGTFGYHVNQDKNDFANWLREVFKKQKLADDLQGVFERTAYLGIIKKVVKPAKKASKPAKKAKKK
jgi:hypothetical protein